MYKRRLAVSCVQISLLLFEIEFLYIIGERVKLQFSKSKKKDFDLLGI